MNLATAGSQQHLPAELCAFGFSWRKRRILKRFLPGRRIRFVRHGRQVPAGTGLLLWGSHAQPPSLPQNVQTIRVEDGFLRSVGLGAALVRPLSWVFDANGIYYDATGPSGLECLLVEGKFSSDELLRAARLRQRIVALGISKYNVGSQVWQRPDVPQVILVPGQVENDASLRFGAVGINTNLALLEAVRARNPHAHIVYKPHPDVTAGLRAQGDLESQAKKYCDEIVTHADIHQLLAEVDAVHTLTSLTGFEALLRDVPVTCYGQPFYSGWGLTDDATPPSRRVRRCSIDELVAAALIRYPSYISWRQPGPSTAEQALDELLADRDAGITVRQLLVSLRLRLGLSIGRARLFVMRRSSVSRTS